MKSRKPEVIKKKKLCKKPNMFSCCLNLSCYNILAASFDCLFNSYDKITTACFEKRVEVHFGYFPCLHREQKPLSNIVVKDKGVTAPLS